jgi:signal transduction histidine kinase
LVETLNHLVEITVKHRKIEVSFDMVGVHEGSVPEKLQLTIYRIVQEQFLNILIYASAKHIVLKLVQKNHLLKLSIKDDGVGFDPTQKITGIGLLNIRTRASLFGGGLEIISSPGKGCELIVDFHLREG